MKEKKPFRINFWHLRDLPLNLLIWALGRRGCVILFSLVTIALFIADSSRQLYFSNRALMGAAITLTSIFLLLVDSPDLEKLIIRITGVTVGILLLVINIWAGARSDANFGSTNTISCLIAERHLKTEPDIPRLIDIGDGRERYLLKIIQGEEIAPKLAKVIEGPFELSYLKSLDRYSVKQNGRGIGTLFKRDYNFYNFDYYNTDK